jgi:hypothetical protein
MLAQASDGAGFVATLVWIVAVMVIAGLPFYGIFKKAGKPGWAGFVPIYNILVLLEVVGRPVWWIALMLIPIVNFVVTIIVMIDLAKAFGKGTGFAVGLILLSWIFLMILGFGSAPYVGAGTGEAPAPRPDMPA